MTPGQKLKAWREANGLTQIEAGKRCRRPVSAATWCDWENDKKVPRAPSIIDLVALTKGTRFRLSWADFDAAGSAA
jgi:transcriptional regulator with XRE-family HTH domain